MLCSAGETLTIWKGDHLMLPSCFAERKFATRTSKLHLEVGEWSAARIRASVGCETHLGLREAIRKTAIHKCQEEINLQCDEGRAPDVEECLHLWGAAE